MEQLPRLKARIASLQEFRDLIRALRALAASHVQEAQSSLEGIRKYVGAVEGAIAEGARLLPKTDSRPPVQRSSYANVLVVICSEHGFTGAFNERLLDRAEAKLSEDYALGIVGRRGAVLAGERGYQIAWSISMATHVGGILAVSRRIADRLATATKAEVIFGEYRMGGNFDIQSRRILPLDPALLARSARGSAPLHHLPPAILLQRLADEYLFAEITRALMESFASENGARLQVMEAADHNIADKLEGLERNEHSLRQEAITSELIDVVTGFEAATGSHVR